MSESDLLAVLARSGLSDVDYADACACVRSMQSRIEAADRLVVEVLDASSYQPAAVIVAATSYVSHFSPHESDAIAA